DDPETGIITGNVFSESIFKKLLEEEYSKLLKASNKDVYDQSKTTTLPISKEIAHVYVLNEIKLPWFIDLLNLNLNNTDLQVARQRIKMYVDTFRSKSVRITENLDFTAR
ncbi:MAG TPA: malate synthase, partial [Chryseosolibacter sp.]|nr:malate synthase [Chryseosolibacter sp.]